MHPWYEYEASLKMVEKEARSLLIERNQDPDERLMDGKGVSFPAWHDEAKELLILRQRLKALGVSVPSGESSAL